MRKIAAFYKITLGLTWKGKLFITETVVRESRKEQMTGIDEEILHIRRSLVYEGG